jgi:general secretion pathway protein I
LEVLVATTVIALALAAIIKSTAMSATSLTHLRDKTFAHWVAMNQMAELQASNAYPQIGRSNGEEEMAGREWYWITEVKKTPDKDVRRVEITVSLEKRRDAAHLTVLTGFFTRYSGVQDNTPQRQTDDREDRPPEQPDEQEGNPRQDE